MIAILDARTPTAAREELRRRGYDPVALPPSPYLPAPVASHPDMLLFFAPDAIFCTKSYFSSAKEELSRISHAADRPLKIIQRETGTEYPEDVLLNALPMGRHLFCHPRATAEEVRTHPAYTLVPVRQGYAKCASLPVGSNALISADPSILGAARSLGIDTLQISSGSILLEGYRYGFIGGCASFAPYGDCDTVYLCGDPETHPDGAKMVEFCTAHGIKLHALCPRPLMDIGTIFLI